MKLSKSDLEILRALQDGGKIHYMGYMGRFRQVPYYFLSSTHKKCTKSAKSLIEKKLIKDTRKSIFDPSTYIINEAGIRTLKLNQ